MSDKETVLYYGLRLVVEWYVGSNGHSQALEYYNELKIERRIGLLKLVKRLGDWGKIIDKTKFNYEGDQLFALKANADRYLCFFAENSRVIITNAFCKKSQKLPKAEKQRALRSKKEYYYRITENAYHA